MPMNRCVAAAVSSLVLFAGTAMGQSNIAREGSGSYRTKLDAMENQPFDTALLDKLTFPSGSPLTAADIDGKVLVVYTFATWFDTSTRPVGMLNALAERHAGDVVILGVHDQRRAEGLAEFAERRRISFPLAVDTTGALRDAMATDQDPDFYVIDRAGNLRYADVATNSVSRAVSQLVEETPEQAAAATAAANAPEDEGNGSRTSSIRGGMGLDSMQLDIPFDAPNQSEYAIADWPLMPNGDEMSSLGGVRSDPLRRITLPATGWENGRVPNTNGRVTVLYFWAPEAAVSYNVMPEMDRLQLRHGSDIVVVGAMVDPRWILEDEEVTAQKRIERRTRFLEFANARERQHRLYDDAGTDLLGKVRGSTQGNDLVAPPYAAIISSDGIVRWHGWIGNSRDLDAGQINRGRMFEIGSNIFDAAIAKTLRADPGVQARRKAEEEFRRKSPANSR